MFLLDDHEIVRQGLRTLLTSSGEIEVVGESGSASEAATLIPALRPDVALLDARLPDGSGIEVCRAVRAVDPDIKVVILTSFANDQDALFDAITAGADGYILKDVKSFELVTGIRQVAAGHSLLDPTLVKVVLDRLRNPPQAETRLASLTPQERLLLGHIADGLTNRQIGEQMSLTEKTVKGYVSKLLAKLGVERRTQAAVIATRLMDEA